MLACVAIFLPCISDLGAAIHCAEPNGDRPRTVQVVYLLNAAAIAAKVADTLFPTRVTAVMMTTLMSAAMSPYSMAVAPLSQLAN